MKYSSVVRRESVRICFLVATLNYLEILAGDILNVYLNVYTKEKVSFYSRDEGKYDQGKVVVIMRALYGFKLSALS